MATLTNEQKQKYLANPTACPYCGSEHIDAGKYDFEGTQVWSQIKCRNCREEWRDVYKLNDIEEVKTY